MPAKKIKKAPTKKTAKKKSAAQKGKSPKKKKAVKKAKVVKANAITAFIEMRKAFKIISKITIKYGSICLLYLSSIIGKLKAKDFLIAAAASVYWLMPLDFIPDFLPFIGFIDDTIVAIFSLLMVISNKENGLEDGLRDRINKTNNKKNTKTTNERSLDELYDLVEQLKRTAPNLTAVLNQQAEKQQAKAATKSDDELINIFRKSEASMNTQRKKFTPNQLEVAEKKVQLLTAKE